MGLWYSAYLAVLRPWLHPQHSKKKKEISTHQTYVKFKKQKPKPENLCYSLSESYKKKKKIVV
jgi:hypothetical protein